MGWQDAPVVDSGEPKRAAWESAPVVDFESTGGSAAVGNPNLSRKRRAGDVSAIERVRAAEGGLNRGVAGLVGMPVDAVANALNLGIAGTGMAAAGVNAIAGTNIPLPSLIEHPVGGSEQIASLLQQAGMHTTNPNPQDPVSQMLFTGGNVIGSSAIPQPGTLAQSAGRALATAVPMAAGGAVAEQVDPRLTALGTMLPAAGVQAAREIGAGARNLVGSRVNKAFETPYAKEGLANEEATGIQLTPGQVTGNASINVAENAARQSFFTRDKVLKQDQKVAMQAIDHVNRLADRISVNQSSPGAMGETLQTALTGTVKRIDGLRDANAARDYGAVRAAGGGEPIISYENTANTLKKIISDYENVAGADAQKITAQAKNALAKVTTEQAPTLPEAGSKLSLDQLREAQAAADAGPQVVPKTVTVDEAMKTRRFYSKAAAGSGNIFEDIAPNLNRELAGKLANAANADFAAAENAGKGPVFDLLKKANQNYRDYSQSLEYVQTSVLGKLLGKDVADAALSGATGNTVAGETVANKMLKMHPSEAKTVSNILAQHYPQVLADSKAFILRDALAKGMDVPVTAGANTIPLSYAKFIKNLPNEEYLKAMRFSPKEVMDIRQTVDAMERAGDRTGYNQSQTAVISSFYNDMKSLASLSGKAALSVGGQIAGLNKIADAMASQEGRAALRTIVTPKQPEAAIQRAMAIIGIEQQQQGQQ